MLGRGEGFNGHSGAGHWGGRSAVTYSLQPQWMLGSQVKRSVEDDAEHGAGAGGGRGREETRVSQVVKISALESAREPRLGGVSAGVGNFVA